MKSKYLLPIVASVLALTGSASAQGPIPLFGAQYEHGLAINLQLTSQGAYSRTSSTNGNFAESLKIDTKKLSNKELLEALKDDGVISDIKGWSVVLITNDTGEIVTTQIKKKNTPSIDIRDYFEVDTETDVTQFNGRYVANRNVYQAVGKHIALGTVTIDIDGFYSNLQGILTVNYLASGSSFAEATVVRGVEMIRPTETVQNANLSSLTGTYDDSSERISKWADGIISGSVVAGPGTLIPRVLE